MSFGVVKAPTAEPGQIGLEGLFYPTFDLYEGDPVSVIPDDLNPLVSLLAYTGDLGLDGGASQSVYVLDKDKATQVTRRGRQAVPARPVGRRDHQAARRARLGDLRAASTRGSGCRSARRPARRSRWLGVILALIGLCGSLFIRPRRVWVRARTVDTDGSGDTLAWGHGRRGRRTRPVRQRRARTRCWPTWSTRRLAEGVTVSDAAVGDPEQPGRGRGRAGLLRCPARAPGRVGRPAAAGQGGRRAGRSVALATVDRGDAGGSCRRSSYGGGAGRVPRPARLPAHLHRRRRAPRRRWSAAGWPRTPTGCRGATCTSSRCRARSS